MPVSAGPARAREFFCEGVILGPVEARALRRNVREEFLPGSARASMASNASIAGMATLTIRRLDESTKARLRVRAAHHGRSMEEEAREILRSALSAAPTSGKNLADAIRQRFAPLGGVELKLPRREPIRRPPTFE